jgi:hypothetical protein
VLISWRLVHTLAILFAGLVLSIASACAQDLTPRAYVITPSGSNAVIFSYSLNTGSVLFDPSIPVTDSSITVSTPVLSYYRSFGLFGRSSNITLSLPYAVGDASALLNGSKVSASRSGLADGRIRYSINLLGGPAMAPREYATWNERNLIGVSLTAILPTGQYDPARLINVGSNRWGFKPEIGYARRRGHWVLDLYAGAWFYTPNSSYYPGEARRTQLPIFAGEAHLTYYATRRLWASVDGNYWIGGRSSLNGAGNEDEQRNSRLGVTVAVPLNQHQAIKVSYAKGAYITVGGNYNTLALAWQYSWLGKHE